MTNVLDLDRIKLSGDARTRDDAIREVGALLVDSGSVTQAYADAMFDREASVSTYMGNLLAIPHGTNEAKDGIISSALAVIRYDQPIDWNGNPVRYVVGIAGKGDDHLGILSGIAIAFSDEATVEKLGAASTPQEFADLIDLDA
ncbi:PTS sugar transporter subunit IIA [Pseudolysinimonas sp.]|jgi:PTS system mannitol-specific IIA component|uniref:PTS sugar transporter subunit IIA n=1 Tax=Pseudolysinimonas sp. TaxID=2680009 RepID=UPI0037842BEE